jgi:hypothetical protein
MSSINLVSQPRSTSPVFFSAVNTKDKYFKIFQSAILSRDISTVKKTLISDDFQKWIYSPVGKFKSTGLLRGLKTAYVKQLEQLPIVKDGYFNLQSDTYTKKATSLFNGKASEQLIKDNKCFGNMLQVIYGLEDMLKKQHKLKYPGLKPVLLYTDDYIK